MNGKIINRLILSSAGNGFQKTKERKSPAESQIIKKGSGMLPPGLAAGLLRFRREGVALAGLWGRTGAPADPNPAPPNPAFIGQVPKPPLEPQAGAKGLSPNPNPPMPRRQCLVPYILSHSRNKSSSFWEAAGRTLQNAFSKSW